MEMEKEGFGMDNYDCIKESDSAFGFNYLTKTDAVCVFLREAIITGRFKAGYRITQQELAEMLKISPTPVREALHKLDAQGILTYIPHHGAQVATPDRQMINEIYLLRANLESLAIQEAVKTINWKTISCLEEISREIIPNLLGKCLEEEDFTPYRDANYKFHKAIYSSSKMVIVPELIDNLWARSMAPDELFLFNIKRSGEGITEHLEIIQALKEEDGLKASNLLKTHIDRTRLAYLEYLDSIDVKEKTPMTE
jgi:DNA-binding GntR family transcriptional regulator